jgi:light-regulated signal transduction histidine kinase (bacteriophytochrome)
MGELIDDLLQFSRTGRQDLKMKEVDMNLILTEALQYLENDFTGRNIEWIIEKLPMVTGDSSLLRQVWINLVSNAVKFSRNRNHPRIEIGYSIDKKEYKFFIRDNGVGFDMKYAQKLFGVFQRYHPTEDFEGTGIGLANVRRIIMKHGGRTWAEAEIDKGAAFYFSLLKNQ